MNDERIEVLDNELSPESLNSTQCGDEMLSEIEEGSELYLANSLSASTPS